MKFYGIKTCASVKKAKAFLDKNNISYEFIDLKKEPLTEEKIKSWQAFCPASSMLNPRTKAYRGLGLKNKDLTNEEAVSIILKDNNILRRPIIEHGLNGNEKFTIGFNEDEYTNTFLN